MHVPMCLSQRTKIFTFSQILSMLLIFIIKNLIHLCKVLLLTERDMKQLLFTLLAFFIYTGAPKIELHQSRKYLSEYLSGL